MANLKHLKNLLLLKPAINSRNLVTIVLVASFFVVYYLSGGKITTPPKVKPGTSFGEVVDENGRELIMQKNLDTEEPVLEDTAKDEPIRDIDESVNRFEKNLKERKEERAMGQKVLEKERKLSGQTDKGSRTSSEDPEKIISPKPEYDDTFSAIEERLKQLEN